MQFPAEHEMTAMIAAKVFEQMLRDRRVVVGTTGVVMDDSPLLVRVRGDATDTPAKALAGYSAVVGDPVACLWLAGRLYVTEAEGV